MKLRRLSVNQFKRFTEPTQLSDLSGGLNLVVGPNELGKSTLLDALRGVLFERHRSQAIAIKALQNDRSGAAPVVELVFEVNNAEYTLTKRFLKSPYAQLRCPDGTVLESDAAEGELRKLLGFNEAGNRGANSESLGMWGVLWVQQGQSFSTPNLSGSALETLSAGLESEVGSVLGGRRGRELPLVIEHKRGELITGTRRLPRGAYKEVCDLIDDLQQRLSDQQQKQQEMSETLAKLEVTEERLRRQEAGNEDRVDQEDLDSAAHQLDDLMRRGLELQAANSELRRCEVRLEQTSRAESERKTRRADLTVAEEELQKQKELLEGLQQHEDELSAPLGGLRQALDRAATAIEVADQAEGQWSLNLEIITRSGELNDLLQHLSDVADVQKRLGDAQDQAERIQVTDKSLQRIRLATNAADQASSKLSVAATRIRLDIPGDRLTGIEVTGATLTDPPSTIEAIQAVAILIPERGRILIEPAITDRAQLVHAERVAGEELRAALRDAGVQTLAEAQLLRDQRRDLEVTATAAKQELERIAPSSDAITMERRIAELRKWLASLPSERKTVDPLQRHHVEGEFHNAQIEVRKARNEERIARVAVDERERAVAEHREKTLDAQSTLRIQTEILKGLQAKLLSDADAMPDHKLAEATATDTREVTEQRAIVSGLEVQWSESTKLQLKARINRLQSSLEQRAKARIDARIEIVQLRERIESGGGAGIDESVDRTNYELEQATLRHARFDRDIQVLDLLSSTLRGAETEAKERYLAPVLNRVHPYLQMLFPNAEISMDEDLNVVGMSRRQGHEERFDHLSMGTQEQIAVLVRLAFAEMLVDQGAPAAVILDDALVFSDDQRMRLMFDILSHAAQRVQIVVFTCREQLFEGLGARQLQLTSIDRESLRSA